MAVTIDASLCSGCGDCIDTCPTDALSMSDQDKAVVSEECVDCGECIEVCPCGAISE